MALNPTVTQKILAVGCCYDFKAYLWSLNTVACKLFPSTYQLILKLYNFHNNIISISCNQTKNNSFILQKQTSKCRIIQAINVHIVNKVSNCIA